MSSRNTDCKVTVLYVCIYCTYSYLVCLVASEMERMKTDHGFKREIFESSQNKSKPALSLFLVKNPISDRPAVFTTWRSSCHSIVFHSLVPNSGTRTRRILVAAASMMPLSYSSLNECRRQPAPASFLGDSFERLLIFLLVSP